MVWLNSNNVRDLRTPFGGVKASGLGHEGGYRSIDFYTDQQAVHITLGERPQPHLRQELTAPPARKDADMTDRDDMTLTSSGFYVSQEAPIHSDNPVPTPQRPPPDILRCAYMELVVTDLAASRVFYVDVLGLYVTEEDDDAIYLRSTEEFIHHNLVLRQGPVAAVAAFSYRVRTPEDLDRAVAFYTELGCRVERRAEGFTKGIGDSVRVDGSARLPVRVLPPDASTSSACRGATTCTRPASSCASTTSTRSPPTCRARSKFMQDLGFRVTEDIQDDEGTVTPRGCAASPPCTTPR